MQNTELRPLGAGEILDRAVTLFVRRFVPIVAVLAMAIVPLLLLEALIAPGSARMFADIGRVLMSSNGGTDSTAAAAALARDQAGMGQYAIVILLSVVVRLLMWSAILAVASAAYAGATTPFGTAYRLALRCWPSQALVALTFGIIASVLFVPVIVAYAIAIAGVFGLIALHAEVIAVIFGIAAAIVVLGGFLVIGAWVYMTYQLASAAVVIESMNPIAAVTAALRRGFARQTWWRTVIAGLIVLTVTQGAALVFAALGILVATLAHLTQLSFVILGLGTIIVEGVLAVFVVVFSTDVRVRREGLDLLAQSEPMSAPA
ncbi:MAG: hypothetical protein JWN27_2084 [Candidatus Eremiobacteraeota bacterium]|nr:hypothetical protein [Candidatus Eremiobacteraeota bacterium]